MRPLSECHGDKVADINRDLWQLFLSTVTTHPDREALVSMWQNDTLAEIKDTNEPYIRWTYRDLHQRSKTLASWLHAQGCRPGSHLVVFLWNSAEWALFFWAAVRAGLVFVPLDPRAIPSDSKYLLEVTKPSVIIVHDADTAAILDNDDSLSIPESTIRISCSQAHPLSGWTALQSINTKTTPPLTAPPLNSPRRGEQTALIIFTSGTTAHPKGCLHTVSNLYSETNLYDPNPPTQPVPWRWLVHTPVSHVFGLNNALRAWKHGETVVFPSRAFDVATTMRALVEERCSVMSAVPPLLKALLAHPQFPGKERLRLEYVTLGGMTISEGDIRMCLDQFGSEAALQAFGMSEGVPIFSWIRSDKLLRDGWHPGVGKALPGANVRICAPKSRVPLPRGEVGELHIGGTSVVKGYLGGVDSEAFYEDDIGNWMRTGDQARMDNDGALYLMGRYKDIIIRAGENIAPIKIEGVLAQIPGVMAQVIGVEDEGAGQVPVAVIARLPEGCTKAAILEKARSLGNHYALDDVLTLAELGLKAFPMTFSGKVRKNELRRIVEKRRTASNPKVILTMNGRAPRTPPSEDKDREHLDQSASVVESLLAAWEELIGTRPPLDARIDDFADSITIQKFCKLSPSKLGHRIYLQDMMTHKTVRALADLTISRTQGFSTFDPNRVVSTVTPPATPKPYDLPLSDTGRIGLPAEARSLAAKDSAQRHEEWFSGPRSRATIAAVLQPLDLDIADIEDIVPVNDLLSFSMANKPHPQSYRYRTCFHMRCAGSDAPRIKQALRIALASRPMLRCVLVHPSPNSSVHLIIRPCDSLFEHLVTAEEVPDEKSRETAFEDESPELFPPQLMTQIRLLRAQDTGTLALSITTSYSVADINSITPFICDLDRLLSAEDPTTVIIPPVTPFKWYADLLNLYSTSQPAQHAIATTAHRLRGISKIPPWPPRRFSPMSSPPSSPKATPSHTRVNEIIILPDIDTLCNPPGELPRTDPEAIARAALALFTAIQTGASHAVIAAQEPARSWPFVPPWLAARLPPASAIAGPTAQRVVCMTAVDLRGGTGSETIGEFVTRVGVEMEEARRHANAPWRGVLEAMGSEAAAVEGAVGRQLFVSDESLRLVGRGSDMETLKPVARVEWSGCDLCWNVSLVELAHLFVSVTGDATQMDTTFLKACCEGYAEVVRRLARAKNWNRSVGDVFGNDQPLSLL